MQTAGFSYGAIIREAREQKGWTRADLARVYGNFFRDQSISEATIRMWEDYNKVPKSAKRRQILAFLLGVPVAALGLEPLSSLAVQALSRPVGEGIDVVAATDRLRVYKAQNHATTVGPLLDDILGTIRAIHDEVPYANTAIRTQFLTLLCDYQQFVASLYRDRSQYDTALYYQNKAYAVAKSLPHKEIRAMVLWRRGLTYHEAGNMDAAISDFLAAQQYKTTSVHFKGTLWASLGHAQAHNATTGDQFRTALCSFDQAEALLEAAEKEQDVHFIRFNIEGYHLNRASAYLGAKNAELRSHAKAFDALSVVPSDETRQRRYTYSTYLQARIEFQKGNLPFATKLAQDATSMASEIGSQVNLNRLALLYQDLLQTPYHNSPDVASLGAELVRAQNPDLLA